MTKSGKTNPRQNLAGGPQRGQPALTESLKDFLRAELRLYKAASDLRPTDNRLAGLIAEYNDVNDAEFSIGPETLRRFIKNEPQKQSDDFVRAILRFLLDVEWITPADVAAYNKDINLRAAVALQSFFGEQRKESALSLYRSIEGTYVSYAFKADRLLKIVLILTLNHDLLVLRALEQVAEYRTSARTLLLRETNNLDPKKFDEIERLMAIHCNPVEASLSSGFGIARSKNINFFLKNELTGGTTIYLVDTVPARTRSNAFERLRSIRYEGCDLAGADTDRNAAIEMVRADERKVRDLLG